MIFRFRRTVYIGVILVTGTLVAVWSKQKTKPITPEAGASGKAAFAFAGPNIAPRLVRRVIGGIVKGDPVTYSSSFPSQGQLCYSFGSSQPPQDYLVVKSGEVTTTYDVSGNTDNMSSGDENSAIEPTFSPDGRRVAFVMGTQADEFSNGSLYVLDVETGSIHDTTRQNIKFAHIEWSRNGRFIAFVVGGDANGNPIHADEFADRPSLWIYDLQKGRESKVTIDNSISDGFAWGANDELFFSASDGIDKVKSDGTKTLVLRNAFSPIISPSGRKIAFLRPGSSFSRSKYPALCVANSDGTHRRVLRREAEFNSVNTPIFAWSRDEKRVFRVQQEATPQLGEVLAYNVQTGKIQLIGQFQSAAFQENGPWFFHLEEETSGDLVCAVNSFTGATKDHYTTAQTLQSIDTSGQTHIWVQSHGGSTLAWSNNAN